MTTREFNLPGGYLKDGKLYDVAVLRPMTGVEEDIIATRGINIIQKLNGVFVNCIEALKSQDGDAIVDKKEIVQAVPKLTVGDRVFLIIALRRISLGEAFDFDIKCPECGTKLEQRVYLDQLETTKMPTPETREYEEELPSGRKCKWRVMDGEMEAKLDKMRSDKDFLSLAIYVRLIELDGQEPTLDKVKQMTLGDRLYLRNMFNEKEGGVETDIEVVCSRCGADFTTMLDFAQTGFFFPTITKKKK